MPKILSPDEIEEFRADLCRVAERLFAEQGYEGVTMRALAAELGCSAMTPYRYFENKEAILDAVRVQAFVRHGVRTEKVAAEVLEPLARLRAYGRAYIEFALDEPNAYRIMFELNADTTGRFNALSDPARRADVLRGWNPLVAVMRELVARKLAFGDAEELAHLAWAMLHGLVTLELSGKLMLGRSLDQLIEPALDNFMRGIGAPPSSSDSGGSHDSTHE